VQPAAPAIPPVTTEVAPTAPSAPPAAAQPAPAPSAVDVAEEHHDGKKEKGKKKKGKNGAEEHAAGVTTAAGRIQLKGRVFALAALQRQERVEATGGPNGEAALAGYNSLDLSMNSVRIGLEYEAPLRWISAVAELELTGRPELKDGYVQARGQHFFARMGQFKLPVSAIDTESPWTLPLVHRGFMHDLLTDWLDVGGRRPGAMVGWRGRGGLRPRFMVGAFQGTVQSGVGPNDRDVDLLEEHSLEAQSYVARAQFEPADVQLGVWYEHRVGSSSAQDPKPKHYPTGGLDAVVDRVLPGGGIRAWVEATAGTSWYEHAQKADDDEDAIFVEARALVGYRFGGTVDEAPYVEPFGFFGVLEPDTDVKKDMAWEAAVGLNAGFWRRARLTLQGEIQRGQRNFPADYLYGASPDRMGLLLQAGVAW
jgi:hypothetical protein